MEVEIRGAYVYASTFGRGVWRAVIPGSCSQNRLVSSDLKGRQFHEAEVSLQYTGKVNGGVGTRIKAHAGERVRLTPGFQVKSGSRFKTALVGCGEDIED